MLKWQKIASSTNKEVNLIDVPNVRRLSVLPVHMSPVSSHTNRVLQFLHYNNVMYTNNSPNNLNIYVHTWEWQNVGTLTATGTRTARAGGPRDGEYGNILMVLVPD